ncbi:hypothetical protein QAD02_001898 [Eretmocerus hayati]|uniref:Uncharacterized protein n=1 Tax=Eretmocerus hayati TaxID=131215 RepID=A0ACC2NK02_9HYME|nr:hypothetical protein QAD02_001898 [Eretmocerus hayati]
MNRVYNHDIKPFVKIKEQPKGSVRFRYASEGRYECIFGENSSKRNNTSPTIQIVNSDRAAFILVSCVAEDFPYYAHPYGLESELPGSILENGVYCCECSAGRSEIQFPSLRIGCVKVKDMFQVLTQREKRRIDPFNAGFLHKYRPGNINRQSLRLCFQVILKDDDGNYSIPLDPVVTKPIHNKKKTSDLKIIYISHYSSVVTGGELICVLCEGIVDNKIGVKFFDENHGWEAVPDPQKFFIHKKAALVFPTPPYTLDIDEPAEVQIQLTRLSDEEVSQVIHFTMLPLETGDPSLRKRKRRRLNETPRELIERNQTKEVLTGLTHVENGPLSEQLRSKIPPEAPLIPSTINWNFSSEASNLLDESLFDTPSHHDALLQVQGVEDVNQDNVQNDYDYAQAQLCSEPILRMPPTQGHFFTDG